MKSSISFGNLRDQWFVLAWVALAVAARYWVAQPTVPATSSPAPTESMVAVELPVPSAAE